MVCEGGERKRDPCLKGRGGDGHPPPWSLLYGGKKRCLLLISSFFLVVHSLYVAAPGEEAPSLPLPLPSVIELMHL